MLATGCTIHGDLLCKGCCPAFGVDEIPDRPCPAALVGISSTPRAALLGLPASETAPMFSTLPSAAADCPSLTPAAASEAAFAEPDSAESPPALTKSPARLLPLPVCETGLSEAVQAAAPSRGIVPDATGVMEEVKVGLLGGSRALLTTMTVEPSKVGLRGSKRTPETFTLESQKPNPAKKRSGQGQCRQQGAWLQLRCLRLSQQPR